MMISKTNLLVFATIANFVAIGTLMALPKNQPGSTTVSSGIDGIDGIEAPKAAPIEAVAVVSGVPAVQRRRRLDDPGTSAESVERGFSIPSPTTPAPSAAPQDAPTPDSSPTTDTTTNPNEEMEEKKYYTAWMSDMQVRYRRSGIVREANIYLEGRPERLRFRIYKDFVRVDIDWRANPEHYKGAIGLLGSYDLGGKRVARDGKTYIHLHTEFGQEWQVQEDEPKLFHTYEGATVSPNKCMLPEYKNKQEWKASLRRRLAGGLTKEQIEKACAHVDPGERDECIFDVTATQDLEMANVY
ncbi:expressed unknown protein [Seminavis robusta]|uniref:VWFD domain-containing protein n=1 Tax=Seminavis robusta TaxID=568900 RepID=A0A9N8H2E3_9STRA|nr:expressed unknown protein [Seminavis robusta]|eukprot:Sro34_g021990.1 n/a (299) ;mRNA; f:78133-79260